MRTVPDCCCCFFLMLLLLTGPGNGLKPSSVFCLGRQCFTLFTELVTNFQTAWGECARRGGHLMSVRSPAALDALQSLVSRQRGKSQSHLWIGLHLIAACPEPNSKLRGYEWASGDDDASDFSHWGANFDSGCSAPRCVVVSTRDDFRWTQTSCSGRWSGFLCEHSYSDDPCARLDPDPGQLVTFTTPLDYWDDRMLAVPPGSTATRLPLHTKFICFSGRWKQAPWSCDVFEGGCEHKCASGPDLEPSCYCPEGRSVNPMNNVTCQKAQGPCAALRCEHACQRGGDGVYACACDQGFRLALDGRACVDVNECSDKRHCPAENTRCVNTANGFECVCADGYRAAGDGRCVDMDECMSAPCEHSCTNLPGSYRCSCYEGYIEVPEEPNRCQLHCGAQECPAQCDPNDDRQCYCPTGYVAEERPRGAFCIDMDECSFYACEQGCVNTFGSYVCSCRPGFVLVKGYKCKELDPGLDEGGSGDATFMPGIVTASPASPAAGPTSPPPRLTVGVLVVVLACAVLAVAFLAFLVYYFLRRAESAGALKGAEEAHGLHRVASDS